MAVIALPLNEVQATVATTTGILAAVGVTAVIILGALTWWSVRRGLRPIDDIISTAGDIGSGKWSQRVEITDPHHEVGRLGNALNAMLGRIENAMRARTEAAAYLRRFVADASHELRTPLTSIRGTPSSTGQVPEAQNRSKWHSCESSTRRHGWEPK